MLKTATNIKYWFPPHLQQGVSEPDLLYAKCFQLQSNMLDFEHHHPCRHFYTKIEVVTMKNIRAKKFPMPQNLSVLQSV